MSFYVGNVAIIKIKPELQQDFSYFFNVEYDKIQDEKFKIFADELKKYYEDERYLKDCLTLMKLKDGKENIKLPMKREFLHTVFIIINTMGLVETIFGKWKSLFFNIVWK